MQKTGCAGKKQKSNKSSNFLYMCDLCWNKMSLKSWIFNHRAAAEIHHRSEEGIMFSVGLRWSFISGGGKYDVPGCTHTSRQVEERKCAWNIKRKSSLYAEKRLLWWRFTGGLSPQKLFFFSGRLSITFLEFLLIQLQNKMALDAGNSC